jgi:hypothetical protein
MTNTHFVNSHACRTRRILPPPDLAIPGAASAIPQCRIYKELEFTLTTYGNTTAYLVARRPFSGWTKDGHTAEAGYCLVALRCAVCAHSGGDGHCEHQSAKKILQPVQLRLFYQPGPVPTTHDELAKPRIWKDSRIMFRSVG